MGILALWERILAICEHPQDVTIASAAISESRKWGFPQRILMSHSVEQMD
jgi:hypothetical protein